MDYENYSIHELKMQNLILEDAIKNKNMEIMKMEEKAITEKANMEYLNNIIYTQKEDIKNITNDNIDKSNRIEILIKKSKEINNLTSAIDIKNNFIKALNNEIENLNNTQEDLLSLGTYKNNKNFDLNKENEALKASEQWYKETIDYKEQVIKNNIDIIKERNIQITKLEVRQRQLIAKDIESFQEIYHLKEVVKKGDTSLNELTERVCELVDEIEDKDQYIEKLLVRINDLKNNSQCTNNCYSNKDKEMLNLNDEIKTLKYNLEDKRNYIHNIEGEKNRHIKTLNQQMSELISYKVDASNIIREKDKYIEKLLNRINYIKNTVDSRTIIIELNKRLEELKNTKNDKIAELRTVINKQSDLIQSMKDIAVTIEKAKICE